MNQKSLTLIETLIVMVIVGILAAVAIPIMNSFTERAIKAEAIRVMGIIHRAEKLYYAKHGVYRWIEPGIAVEAERFRAIGLEGNDLTGTYFSHHCYSVGGYEVGTGGDVWCFSHLSQAVAPRAREVTSKYWGLVLYKNGMLNDHILP